ncbi:hypothetical protein, partial [Escherichia coli]|uniref:hypothetical protein n=1 Tax=Escherichia coli TaxID=562 RepID=UPI0005C443CD
SVVFFFSGPATTGSYAGALVGSVSGVEGTVWIHGHIHRSADYRIGGTRILANPHGRRGENPAFDPSLVLEI